MHQIVARQILAGEPPQTWQAVQRLSGLSYDWHIIMHMIAGLVAEDVHAAMTEHRQPDPDFIGKLRKRTVCTPCRLKAVRLPDAPDLRRQLRRAGSACAQLQS
jgi:hypothetical protein